ncbi:MAG: glycosyltransferase, partial [Myxococcaceae bacterium]
MTLPLATWILIALAGVGVAAQLVELYGLWQVRHRRWPEPPRYPGFSVLVPLAGADEELRENLESHLAADYPGEWELVLGVRSEEDPAYPIARAFVAQHPERVRLALQQGEPGHNPKVNQLITLTQRARYDFIAVADSNVRVGPGHLREHAAVLATPNIGLSTHGLGGIGERSLGAILDNMTLASFCAPNLAAGDA